MKTIPLTQGKVALVDDEDFERLNAHKWYAHSDKETFYAVRNSSRRSGKRKMIMMHREILSAPKGIEVDHKFGNGLDNRKENLRLATQRQNAANRRKNKNGSSRFRGVWWNKKLKKWQAAVSTKHIGLFACEVEAARAYDTAAIKLFGEFARPNFPV